MDMVSLCVSGSNMEQKLAEAASNCLNQEPGRNLQKNEFDNQCPSFNEITFELEQEYGMDACIVQSFGWVTEDFQQLNETIMGDILTLDPALQANLSDEQAHQECAANALEAFTHSNEYELLMSCMDSYSEEEISILTNIAYALAGWKCFLESFQNACAVYAENSVMAG